MLKGLYHVAVVCLMQGGYDAVVLVVLQQFLRHTSVGHVGIEVNKTVQTQYVVIK